MPTTVTYPGLTTFPGFTLFPGYSTAPGTPLASNPSTTFTLQGDSGAVSLNIIDANNVKWIVQKFDGWGSPKPSIQVVPKPRQLGAWAGLSYPNARYLAFQLLVIAPSPAALVTALDNLYAAVDYSNTVLTVNEAGITRSMIVRRSDEIFSTRINAWTAQVNFQIVAIDPRKLGYALTGSTSLPSVTGGLSFPITFPLNFNSVVNAGSVSLTNPGNTRGPVKLRIDGPCVGPVITHTGTGAALVFSSSLALGTGEWLTVDMTAQTALANDQASRAAYITTRGWSGFDPGPNGWAFAATSYDPAARLTVTAAPAWN